MATKDKGLFKLTRAMSEAIRRGDLERVKQTIAAGADPHFTKDEPLCMACEHGRLDVAKYLVEECGADPNADGRPCSSAARKGKLAVLIYLTETCKADPRRNDDRALTWAAAAGHLKVVKYLAEQCGADPRTQGEAPLALAVGNGRLRVVRYLIEAWQADPWAEPHRPFVRGVWDRHLPVLKYLVEERLADPRANGDEAIVHAAEFLQRSALDYLAARIFAPTLWRGKSRREIEGEARKIVGKFRALPLAPAKIKLVGDAVATVALRTIMNLEAEEAQAMPPLVIGGVVKPRPL